MYSLIPLALAANAGLGHCEHSQDIGIGIDLTPCYGYGELKTLHIYM